VGTTKVVQCPTAGIPFLKQVFIQIRSVVSLYFPFSNIKIVGKCLLDHVALHVVSHTSTHDFIARSLLCRLNKDLEVLFIVNGVRSAVSVTIRAFCICG
jgi:hypothetical protein